MTPAEVARVLAKASAVDQRTIGDADVLAWHEIVGRYQFADALEAVRRHYTETSARLMPADLIRHIKAIREDTRRTQHSEPLALPGSFEDDPDRDRRITDAKDGPLAEFFRPFAEKRSVNRALREEHTIAEIEESRTRYLKALEAMSADETAGVVNEVLLNSPTDWDTGGDRTQAAVAYVRDLEARLAAAAGRPKPFTEEK